MHGVEKRAKKKKQKAEDGRTAVKKNKIINKTKTL